jgi:hypothetical protein
LPYTALADQKHGRRQCQRDWEGAPTRPKGKIFKHTIRGSGENKTESHFSGNIVK